MGSAVSSPETTPISAPVRSRHEAEEEAAEWLDWLVEHGEHGWIRTSRLGLRAQPTQNLPCHLLAATMESGSGYMPFLMLMAGKKRRNRYWQYTTKDPLTGLPHPRDKVLGDIDKLVGALSRIADIPHLYPNRRIRTDR